MLQILNAEDDHPVEFASVIHEKSDFLEHSNAKGFLDISALKDQDSIIIHRIGYENQMYSYAQLADSSFKISIKAEKLQMEEIVISGNKWKENSLELSQRVTSIESRKVELMNPQTTADLVGLSGEVFIQKSQQGGGSPMIRGFAANRVLISYDGVRMNNAIFRSGNVQNIIGIDPNMLEYTEVIFGPGSSIYGSDAIGGVMNFSSKEPVFQEDTNRYTDANAFYRYSSANSEGTAHLDFRLGGEKIAGVTGITFSRFGDLKMGSNGPDAYLRNQYVQVGFTRDTVLNNDDPQLQVNSNYTQLNLMQKLAYKVNDDLEFEYMFSRASTTDIPRYDRLIQRNNGNFRFAQWEYGPQIWNLHKLSTHLSKSTSIYDDARISLSYQNFQESRKVRAFNAASGIENKEVVDAFSANIDFRKYMNSRDVIYYGFEGIQNRIGSSVSTINTARNDSSNNIELSTRYPDGSRWSSYAGYLSLKKYVNDKLNLQASLRYNVIAVNSTFDSSNFLVPVSDFNISTSALTGAAGLVYELDEKTFISLNAGTAFRAPNIDDVSKVFDSEPGAVVIPNPDLTHEYAYSLDLGIRKNIEDVIMLRANAFYTILENAMVRRDFLFNGQDSINYQGELSRVQAIQNATEARVYGFQVLLRSKFGSNFSSDLRYNYQDGEEEMADGSTSALRHAAPDFASANLQYKKGRISLLTEVIYNGEIAFNDLAVNERNKPHLYAGDALGRPYSPSWYIWNFRSSLKLRDHIQLFFGIENITDQRYRPYSSGIAGAGRNYVLTVKLSY